MTRPPRAAEAEPEIGGIILAAGEGRRFGGPKQLAQLDGRPLIEHALAAMLAVPAIDPVVIVLGAHAERIQAEADLRGAEIVVCADWAEGLSASVRCGLTAAGDADEVVILLADQPFVSPAAIARVRAADGPAARAVYGGAPGHPVVLRRALLERARDLQGDRGFRDLLADATPVECGDVADPRDIDTPADLDSY